MRNLFLVPASAGSESELHAELNLPGCIGLAERPAETRQVTQTGGRVTEYHPVERVEELSSKLEVHRFPDLGALDDAEVLA
jgi:hypothetical protein